MIDSSPAAASNDPLLGQAVGGSYRITRLLGEGGMGKVYEAKHIRLPRRAAVKVLQPELARAGESFERFQREAEVASSLGSRHIVQVFDLGALPDGSPYMLMEFLEGRDLASYLAEMGSLPPLEVLKLMEQAVAGVGAAHEKKVIHRDLKPANLFLAREVDGTEVLKVVDFGLSKVRGLSRSLTGLNSLGTPAYMSPEQIRSSRQVDGRTDIYALGVTLFELLTGVLPFDHEQVNAVLDMVLNDPVPSVRAYRPSLHPDLDRVIARALAKDPDARYATVFEFWGEAKLALRRCTAQDLAFGDDATARSNPSRHGAGQATQLLVDVPRTKRPSASVRTIAIASPAVLALVGGLFAWHRTRIPAVPARSVAQAMAAPVEASVPTVPQPAPPPPPSPAPVASAPKAAPSASAHPPGGQHEAQRPSKPKRLARRNSESAPALFNGI